jgi:hypothetical protein
VGPDVEGVNGLLKSRREQSKINGPLVRGLVADQHKFHQTDSRSLSIRITHGVGL